MFKLSVPSTVNPQHAENYLDSLSAVLRAKYGGNTVKQHGNTYYDNAGCDTDDPQIENDLYNDLIRRALP